MVSNDPILINTSKGRIEYCIAGRGEPILFIHGGHVNCRETIFRKGLDLSKFCCITPSRPGYGSTPLTSSNKSPKGTAELFIALLNELQLNEVIVIGISAGGLTALEVADQYPKRIKKLVLMSALTNKMFNNSDKQFVGGKIIFAPGVEYFTWLLYRFFFRLFPKTMANAMFKSLSKYRPIVYTQNEAQELRNLTFRMRSQHGFYNDLHQAIDQKILFNIECPTLILHSEYDNALDTSHPLNASATIKNSRFVFFKNHWGHMLWIGIDYEPILNELKKYIED